MTKQELEQLVKETYALWNKELYDIDRPTVCRAWWTLLHDLNYHETTHTIKQLALTEKYCPPPGTIRTAHLKTLEKNPPPTPHEFWAHLQTLIKNHNNGTHQNTPTKIGEHEITKQTLQELGATALTLTTNGDRDYALQCFNKHLTQWTQNRYTAEETP